MKTNIKKISLLFLALVGLHVGMNIIAEKQHTIKNLTELFVKTESVNGKQEINEGDIVYHNNNSFKVDFISPETKYSGIVHREIDLSKADSQSWIQKILRTHYTLEAERNSDTNEWHLITSDLNCRIMPTSRALILGIGSTLATALIAYSLWH